MALLHFTNDEGVEQSVHVGRDRPEITIGRTKACDLITSNSTVSRRHASVSWENGEYILRDLNSANGTYHHRQRVTEVKLQNGDAIFVGSLPLSFVLESSDAAAAAASKSAAKPESKYGGLEPLKEVTADYTESAVVVTPQKPAPAPAPAPVRAPAPGPAPAPIDEPTPAKLPEYSAPIVADPVRTAVNDKPCELSTEDSLAMADLERIIDAADIERAELITALDSAQERYYEASARADNAEAVAIDLKTKIVDLEDERKALSERLDLLERENSERLSDYKALRQERDTLGIEAAALRTEVEELRLRPLSVDTRELDAARQTIEDMKLANRGYLKKISRLLEERENSQAGGFAGSAVMIDVSDRINELASRAVTSLDIVNGILRESRGAVPSVAAVSEIRAALIDAVDAVGELKKSAVEMRQHVKGGRSV